MMYFAAKPVVNKLIMLLFPVLYSTMALAQPHTEPGVADAAVLRTLTSLAQPLTGEQDLAPLLQAAGAAKLVLLGEASHGTSEYYQWRAQISKRLIQEKGFRFIAVEGDWASLYRLNRYVKHLPGAEADARAIMQSFQRWPQWMWANEETLGLIQWLHAYNGPLAPEQRVGFYGIDVYDDQQSLQSMLAKLDAVDAELAAETRAIYQPYLNLAGNARLYTAILQGGGTSFATGAKAGYDLLARRTPELLADNPAAQFNIMQSALVVKNAEKHYRAMQDARLNSWNKRADHFFLTVERLLAHYGADARGIVWAHNTHIGDARATPMARAGQRNIGMAARLALPPAEVFAVGFGSWRGTVIAGRSWGAPRQVMTLPPGGAHSYEALMHAVGQSAALFIFDPANADLSALTAPRGHRAVGVVYNPEHEFPGNYVPTQLVRRYNAFIFINETRALQPIDTAANP